MTAGAARELADLHAAGWVHGDLQPDHVLFEGDRTHIIDLACAQGPADVPFYVHRGGLAHTTAPEIAERILSSEHHVTTTPPGRHMVPGRFAVVVLDPHDTHRLRRPDRRTDNAVDRHSRHPPLP
ncbi:MAG: hypothetical protein ACRDRS_20445 [Pseudonocardiaceae bacterium]